MPSPVSPSVANPTQFGDRPTLGRLNGLSGEEADRGARALWLTGDGHRAVLFHLGALTRINELGLLARLETIGAASGGSIAAAVLVTRVGWPLAGGCEDWAERVAEPLRELAADAEHGGGQLRRPFPGRAGEAAREERYARELLGGAGDRRGPRFVIGAPGLALSEIGAAEAPQLEWDIAAAAADGYPPDLVTEAIGGLHTGLDGFGEAARAVLENHGYLLAESAVIAAGIPSAAALQVPHPEWMDGERARAALAGDARRPRVRRLQLRRRGEPADHRPR